MLNFFKRLFRFFVKRKIMSIVGLVLILGGVGYWIYSSQNKNITVEYTMETVTKEMLISSVSGTGQVSPMDQVEVKSKVSGDVTLLNVKAGQSLKDGDIIATVDSREAVLSLSEARVALENAQLDLKELLAPTDTLTLTQAENSLADAKDTLTKLKTSQENEYNTAVKNKTEAVEDLAKAYEDAYNDIASAFLDFPDIVTGAYTVLNGQEISDSEWTVGAGTVNSSALTDSILYNDWEKKRAFSEYLTEVNDYYLVAKNAYDNSFAKYKTVTRNSSHEVIEDLLDETLDTARKISDAVKAETNLLDSWCDYRERYDLEIFSQVEKFQSSLSSYTSKTNSHVSGLLSAQSSLSDKQDAIDDSTKDYADLLISQPMALASAERSLKEKEEKLADLKAGADEIDIKNARLTVQQKQNSLTQASQALADHSIIAPFDGTVAEVNVAKGDSVNSGSSIVTLITDQKIAVITLNEIDVAKVKVGQKVNLTFDAASDLNVTGEVVEVDTLGTTNSGVVSYDIKILFDVEDDRIKPGMTVSASIVIEAKVDALTVSAAAVKTDNQGSYVEIMNNGTVEKKRVTTGVSNDIKIEVTEGLSEGDEVIAQKITTGGTGSTTNSSDSRGGMGGSMMMLGR